MRDPEAEPGNSSRYMRLKNRRMDHIRPQTAKLSPEWGNTTQPRQSALGVQADDRATGRTDFFSQVITPSQVAETVTKSRSIRRGNQARSYSFCAATTKIRNNVQNVDHRS